MQIKSWKHSNSTFTLDAMKPAGLWVFTTSPGYGPIAAETIATYVNMIVAEKERVKEEEKCIEREKEYARIAQKAERNYKLRIQSEDKSHRPSACTHEFDIMSPVA